MYIELNKLDLATAELLENGYDYMTGEYKDGGKLFRKQKRSFLGSWSRLDHGPPRKDYPPKYEVFLLRKILTESRSVTNSNPVSTSSVASSMVLAVLQMYASF